MEIIIKLMILFLSFFGYDIAETDPVVSCEIHGVAFDSREDLLMASVTDNGESQTYVWSIDTYSLEQPELIDVLPFTEEAEYTVLALYPFIDIFQAVADDDEIIFIILDGQTGEATRHDLSVCQRG